MKVTENGRVELTKVDVDRFEADGFTVSWHTPYYLNCCCVESNTFDSDGNKYQIGFFCWLKEADVYIGDKKIIVKDMKHLKKIIKLMYMFKDVMNLEKEI